MRRARILWVANGQHVVSLSPRQLAYCIRWCQLSSSCFKSRALVVGELHLVLVTKPWSLFRTFSPHSCTHRRRSGWRATWRRPRRRARPVSWPGNSGCATRSTRSIGATSCSLGRRCDLMPACACRHIAACVGFAALDAFAPFTLLIFGPNPINKCKSDHCACIPTPATSGGG